MADLYVTTGTIDSGATNIDVDVTSLEGPIVVGADKLVGKVNVIMTADYARHEPVGFPSPPFMTGVTPSGLDFPKTISSGAAAQFLACEAAALIAAGAASFVSNA
ncbi:MAG: hypothetical protein WBE80_07870 [Methylocella sp.]